MRRALAFQPGDLAGKSGLLDQPAVARRDRLGERELIGLAAGVFEGADAPVAGERRGDEPRLALVVLSHGSVHRAKRGVGIDFDLVVLVALPLDPSLALFDL
jgi:hypothetical protein